jgi:hypothetical protein
MVIVPTVLGFLFFFHIGEQGKGFAFLATVGLFLLTSFLAGGALTLVEIAQNTKGCMEALRDTRDGLRASQQAPRPQ